MVAMKTFKTDSTDLKVRAYRCATTAGMLLILVESLGAGKKWS